MANRKRSLVPILLIAAVLSLAAYLTGKYDGEAEGPGSAGQSLQSAPDISLEGIRQTYVEKGVKKWEMKAASARLLRSDNQAQVNDIVITFYTADNRSFRVTADQGLVSLETRDARISGNVIIYHPDFKIYTESLRYHAERHIIVSESPVRIESPSLHLAGDRLCYDLSSMRAELAGNVNGRINENLTRQ